MSNGEKETKMNRQINPRVQARRDAYRAELAEMTRRDREAITEAELAAERPFADWSNDPNVGLN